MLMKQNYSDRNVGQAGNLLFLTSDSANPSSMITGPSKRKRTDSDIDCEQTVKVRLHCPSKANQDKAESRDVKSLQSERKRKHPDTPNTERGDTKRRRMKLNLSTQTKLENDDLSPDYNAYNFWKPLLPDIEAELALLTHTKMDITEALDEKTHSSNVELAVDPQYSTFNFWKDPIPDIDLDLDFILD